MKIAPGSSTLAESIRRPFSRPGVLALLALFHLCILLPACVFPSRGANLPPRLGRITDYGNVLSQADRKLLTEQVEALEREGFSIIVLVSRRDPFSNPVLYSSKIKAKWGLKDSPPDVFLVFVQEGTRWEIYTEFSSQARGYLRRNDAVESFQNTIQDRTASGAIRRALLFAVDRLHHFVVQQPAQTEEESSGGIPFPAPFQLLVVGGPVVGGVGLIYLFWREIKTRCPECGSKLRIESSKPFPSADYETKTARCEYCGFSETRRTGR